MPQRLIVSRSLTASPCLALTVSNCASLASLPLTVPRSLTISLCLALTVPHCVSLAHYLTVFRTLSTSLLCLALSVSHCCVLLSQCLSASLCRALSVPHCVLLSHLPHCCVSLSQCTLVSTGCVRQASGERQQQPHLGAVFRSAIQPGGLARGLTGRASGPPPAAPILPAALGGAPAQMATDSAQHADLIQSCRLRAVGRAPLFLMPLVPTLHSRGHARRPSDRRGCISRPDCAGRGLLDLRHPHPVSSREVPASPALAARVRPATEPNDRSHTARAAGAKIAKVRASWGRDTYTGLSATGLWRFL